MATAAETLNSGAAVTTEGGRGAPGPGATAAGWWDTVKDADTKSWLATKNFPDAEKAFSSYRNLETLFGADKAGRTVLLPRDDNDAEGWKTLSARLGVPEKADGYKLPLPEGVQDDAFAKTAANWFHAAGVPPRAANQIANAWNAWIAEQVKVGENADRAESARQMAALEQELGPKFAEQRELSQRGFRAFAKNFGLDDKATLERAESVLGAANLTKFFAGLGFLDQEDGFVDGGRPNALFTTTAGDAQRQIEQIRNDRIAGKISDHEWRSVYEKKVMDLGKIVARSMAA